MLRKHEVLLALYVVCARSAIGAQLPVAPVDPTYQDCQGLGRAYDVLIHEAHDAVFKCLRGPSQIGLGQEVNAQCGTYRTVRAWPQCVGAELRACQVVDKDHMEQAQCQARAGKRSLRERAADEDTSRRRQHISALDSRYRNAKSTADRFDTAASFLSDPKRFLFDALKSSATQIAARMFDAEGILRPERFEDANVLYSLASGTSRDALLARGNGLVREIQNDALDQISASFARTMRQMDEALHQMDELSRTSQSGLQRVPAAPNLPPPPVSSQAQGGYDCSTLKNPAVSRALMESDEAAWLSLVGRCQ